MATRTPTGPPPSVGKLEKYVLAYATANGMAVGRVRHWISFMLLSGALDQAARGGARFVVKGGVALELRLPGRARATDDLDIVVLADEDDLVGALDAALSVPYQDCTFTRRPDTHALGDKGVRVWVQIAYRSQRWATVQVDLVRPDAADTETERLGAIPLSHFGLTGPPNVVCLSLRYHIAQKFHGMTKDAAGGTNERFRDAVDLLLLRDLITNAELPSVREACEETFRVRAEHLWPPPIALPVAWTAPFAAMAAGVGLSITDLAVAETELSEFCDAIRRS
jgi:Nucleotidyl transferase AbiEii toxin, Type IV TA system